ncbi:MAG TPA: M50 family metallopeptidase [Propionibacteriaceae bacterium]|nr:M50 family metallopeptidase [Propionibacteriaceae bacterium]
MTTLLVIVSAVLFFALLMASIALHELGHLIPARLFGVKTTQYFIGFGKTLWSRRRGELEFGVKAIPLGGYVRLVGMYPPAPDAPPGAVETAGPVTRLATMAREAEYETITPADHGRLFYEKPTWQKIIVMFGGPAMNFLLAFLIFLGVNQLFGSYQPTLTVTSVSQCVIPAARTDRTCTASDPASPAKLAGIRPGDTLVSFNGQRLTSWTQLSDLIRANRSNAAVIVVDRNGSRVTLPTVHTMTTGVPDRLDPSRTVEAGFLGVGPGQQLVHPGLGGTAQQMWTMTEQSVVALARFPVTVWNVAADVVTGHQRNPNGPISIVGASQVAGEIATMPGLSLGDRVASWFLMLGSVNLFVALLNCVPLLPLDGGHIAGALYEGLKRAAARAFHRPDPGHVDTARMLPVAYVVGGFLLISGLVLVVADIVSPLRLG